MLPSNVGTRTDRFETGWDLRGPNLGLTDPFVLRGDSGKDVEGRPVPREPYREGGPPCQNRLTERIMKLRLSSVFPQSTEFF